MLGLPLQDSLTTVARYYQLILTREHSPRCSLEKLLEEASLPLTYRARVFQTLWATYVVEGDLKSATKLTLESMRIAADPSVDDLLSTLEGLRQIAVVRSIEGDHKQALDDLEGLLPIVRQIGTYYPAAYYDFLNGLAVELGEAGRVSEAEAACAIAVASPFAPAYPEWSETRDEIAAKRKSASPSVVAIHRAPEAALATQAESRRKPEPFSALAFSSLPSNKDFFQRSIIPIPARTTIVLNRLTPVNLRRHPDIGAPHTDERE